MTPHWIEVSTTVGQESDAQRIASILVEERLAACVHVGAITSTYWWHGKVEVGAEWNCRIKTTMGRLEDLAARIKALHAYETPELIVLPIVTGDPRYLEWLEAAVHS